MNANHFAIILYGSLTLILGFALAFTVGSKMAMLLLVLATGLTYVFQVLQEETNSRFVLILWLAVIALFIAAMAYIVEKL